MDLQKKDVMIAVGVTIGAALLVLLLKSKQSSGGGSAGSGGVTDIMGGFSSAGTVYVPTSSYDISYNNYKGAVTYTTSTTNQQTTETTTYAPINSPINSPTNGSTVTGSPVTSIVTAAPSPTPAPPTIIGNGGQTVINPPTQQTNNTYHAPAPVAPPPPPAWKAMGNMHYARPSNGWDPNSVVDYVKQHGGYADFASMKILAQQSGIQNYSGTAQQNQQFMANLKRVYGN